MSRWAIHRRSNGSSQCVTSRASEIIAAAVAQSAAAAGTPRPARAAIRADPIVWWSR